jgi:hypothetical protein
MQPTLILGREPMGPNATENDYDAWVAYVVAHLGETCGFDVEVIRRPDGTGLQTNDIRGGTDSERYEMAVALHNVWHQWCSDGAPTVKVPSRPPSQPAVEETR